MWRASLFWLRSNRQSQKQPGPGDTQKMSTDKLQALRNAFTEIVSEPPLPAISFDEEAATATLSSAANTAEPGELAVGDSPTSPKHLATPASSVDKELAPASLADAPKITEEPALQATVLVPPTDAEAAVRSGKQAKSLLAGLG